MIRFFRLTITISLVLLFLHAWSLFIQKGNWILAGLTFWLIHDFDILRSLIYALFRENKTNEQ